MIVSDRVEGIIRPIVESEGFELVEVEYKKEGSTFFLRVHIDKPEGITHEDCKKISDQTSAILDIEEVISTQYTLEVSSPGVERPLKRREDYVRFTGKKISVKLFTPANGRKKLIGTILQAVGDKVTIQCDKNEELTFHFKDIAKANLFFEF